jgi:two-component system CheB/CheR fusion protein
MRERNSSNLRTLVVDDYQDSADSLALLVQVWGHEVVVAYNGPDALGLVRAHQPDVVLLDIAMPGLDGYEVARRLRQMPSMNKALLVAITGYGSDADVRRCKETGIDYHFTKPVDPPELQRVLAKAERLGRDHQQMVY